MLKIKCFLTKKGNKCVALCFNDIFLTFDEVKMSLVSNLSIADIRSLDAGDEINIK